jgi:hypothetical protein
MKKMWGLLFFFQIPNEKRGELSILEFYNFPFNGHYLSYFGFGTIVGPEILMF